MFVKLKEACFLTPRTYAVGSVVEVSEEMAQELVKLGIASPDDGPASEPESEAKARPERTEDTTETMTDPKAQHARHAVKKG